MTPATQDPNAAEAERKHLDDPAPAGPSVEVEAGAAEASGKAG